MPSLDLWNVYWSICPTEGMSSLSFRDPSFDYLITNVNALAFKLSVLVLSFLANDDFYLDDAPFVHLHDFEREIFVGQSFV